MRAKLDENLGRACAALLDRGGLEVTTVAEERLCGADDATVIGAARREGRCLVTIDLDFANPLLFSIGPESGWVFVTLWYRRGCVRRGRKWRSIWAVGQVSNLGFGSRSGCVIGIWSLTCAQRMA